MAQLHSLLLANHRPYADVYADATERLAATGFERALGGGVVAFAADDLYKKVLQLDDASEWILTAITPTWVQTNGAGVLANDSVTNAKLANMAQATIKGRASGAGTGDPTDLTAAQVKTILALAAADVSDFTEAVQDVAGGMLTDSATIDFSYNDGAGTATASLLAAGARAVLLEMQRWTINFTANGDAYIAADVAMTVDAGIAAIGTGTLAYEKSTAAAPGTFSSTTLPAVLEAGAWLKVTVSAITGFKAVELKRTA